MSLNMTEYNILNIFGTECISQKVWSYLKIYGTGYGVPIKRAPYITSKSCKITVIPLSTYENGLQKYCFTFIKNEILVV